MKNSTKESTANLDNQLTTILIEQQRLSLSANYPRRLCEYGDIWNTSQAIHALDDIISLVIRGADPEACPSFSPLLLAVSQNRPDRLETLLRIHFNPEQKSQCFRSNDVTPLLVAAAMGQHQAVRLLLEANVDPNAKTIEGYTPLYEAVASGNVESCQLLIKAGADVNFKNKYGQAPAFALNALGHTLRNQRTAIAGLLIEAGAEIQSIQSFIR